MGHDLILLMRVVVVVLKTVSMVNVLCLVPIPRLWSTLVEVRGNDYVYDHVTRDKQFENLLCFLNILLGELSANGILGEQLEKLLSSLCMAPARPYIWSHNSGHVDLRDIHATEMYMLDRSALEYWACRTI